MGVSRSPAQLVAKLDRWAVEIEGANRAAVSAAALIVVKEIRTRTAVATGGDMRLSGVGRKGAKVGVGYDVKGTKNATALIRARGPFHLVERDVRRHDIAPKRVKTGRNRGPKALTIKGRFAASAKNAGGSKGRHPFEHGAKAAQPKAVMAFQREQDKALAKVFGL